LTAPRVRALTRYYDKQLKLDERTLERSHVVLRSALQGGRQLTRRELGGALSAAGIEAQGQRLGHLLMHAELDALVGSGARCG
jgi:hypothetical protein